MQASTTKFSFRIRTRHGLVIDKLMIRGRDEADAERKLRQMYQYCEIIARDVVQASGTPLQPSFEDIVSLVTRQPSVS